MAIAVTAIRTGQANRFCPVTQSVRQLSAHQIRYVRHLNSRPILAFDADSAGDQSASRVGALFAIAGANPGVVHLPPGEDPASWLAYHGIRGLAVLAPGANPDRHPVRRPAAHRPGAFIETLTSEINATDHYHH